MGTNTKQNGSPLDAIPGADAIRARLTTIYAEAKLLRPLLRLAERRAREVERRQSKRGAHAD